MMHTLCVYVYVHEWYACVCKIRVHTSMSICMYPAMRVYINICVHVLCMMYEYVHDYHVPPALHALGSDSRRAE